MRQDRGGGLVVVITLLTVGLGFRRGQAQRVLLFVFPLNKVDARLSAWGLSDLATGSEDGLFLVLGMRVSDFGCGGVSSRGIWLATASLDRGVCGTYPRPSP